MLDFVVIFIMIWWQTDKKNQEIMKQSYKDMFIWPELPVVWLIIGLIIILNIEVNGALAIHVIAHKSLTEIPKKLRF